MDQKKLNKLQKKIEGMSSNPLQRGLIEKLIATLMLQIELQGI